MKKTVSMKKTSLLFAVILCITSIFFSGCECEHEYSDRPYVIQYGSCIQDKILEYTCQKCGYSYQKTVTAHGHNYVDGICANCNDATPNLKLLQTLPVFIKDKRAFYEIPRECKVISILECYYFDDLDEIWINVETEDTQDVVPAYCDVVWALFDTKTGDKIDEGIETRGKGIYAGRQVVDFTIRIPRRLWKSENTLAFYDVDPHGWKIPRNLYNN